MTAWMNCRRFALHRQTLAHWNKSCGIWNSYVKRRLPGYTAAGVPWMQLDADMVDARQFDEAKVAAQLDAFISGLATARV